MKCFVENTILFWTAILGFSVGIFLAKNFLVASTDDPFINPNFRNIDFAERIESSFNLKLNHHFHKKEDTSVAEKLEKDVKILCWIMTGAANHKKKAYHIYKTWGKRCNKLLFMSSTTENGTEGMEIVALPVEEGRQELFHKTKEAFKYVYEKYFNDFDWFLKADDDT